MEPWVLVAGGFHRKGGIDKANAALASFLISRGHRVHLVTHEADTLLAAENQVTIHQVSKPAGSYLLGDWLLGERGRSVAREVIADSPRARVVVNGGNCAWPDINWVHSVHHAWPPCDQNAPAWFKLKNRVDKAIARRREWLALRSAKSCNRQFRADAARSDQPARHFGTQNSHAVSWFRLRTGACGARASQLSAPMARQAFGPSFGSICRRDRIRRQQGD